ncbi:YciI family protein [Lutimonas zeaxanthinifaciens]|uniref:YciI family protein n=1 Tax=Lutimonas zeaxanthinifaciens TaxID=3060215 RepID=UPI00265D133A|nr:YciI family protein [Lutimonas sp. YSD2104]WKK66416.1 YciI family protein [Lutimonas sp. YSD2104]
MKQFDFSLVMVIACSLLFLNCQNRIKETTEESNENQKTLEVISEYDSISAASYGADEYGMKKYVIAFLKRGPNKSLDSIKRDKLQRAHLDNISKLAEEGKLVLAGPFFGNEDLRGIYIFDVQSIDEARLLTETDPSIKQGILVMELKEWYGSAGLMAIPKIHPTLAKKDI